MCLIKNVNEDSAIRYRTLASLKQYSAVDKWTSADKFIPSLSNKFKFLCCSFLVCPTHVAHMPVCGLKSASCSICKTHPANYNALYIYMHTLKLHHWTIFTKLMASLLEIVELRGNLSVWPLVWSVPLKIWSHLAGTSLTYFKYLDLYILWFAHNGGC